MRYTVRPISDRTGFTGKSRRSAFGSSWSSTESLLLAEVGRLNGRDLVLEVDVPERAIRIDGGLYANARPSSPGVRIAFESKHGPLTYGTDEFTSWQDNVRAIAKSLEALRMVDRYGVSRRGEQYTGWKAIGAGRAMPSSEEPTMDAELAWSTLGSYTAPGDSRTISELRSTATNDELRAMHRRARARWHTDRPDGDRKMWDLVEQAADVLGILR